MSEIAAEDVRREEKLEPFIAEDCKVLVVDDNAVNRKIARIFMQSYGLEINEAESGAAAIALVRQTRYDIIFMDHMMPEMDGIEAVQIIRSECGENGKMPVVIALSANAMEGVRETFLENGFQDFIAKPLDRRPLHEALLRWIPREKISASEAWLDIWKVDDSRKIAFQKIVIEGIDTDEVVRHSSGSIDDYLDLLNLYCLDGKRKILLLRELWEKRDYRNYGIEVHGLKSASANVGAMSVSINAREHERAVDRGDEKYVDEHVCQLLSEYEAQMEHISGFLAASRTAGHADAKVQEIDPAALEQEIRAALERLENFRAKECAHKIEEILQYQLQTDLEARLTEIQGLLKLYEDDKAEQLLRDLLEDLPGAR